MNEKNVTYLQKDLGIMGVAYLRQCLEAGKTMSHLLLRNVDFATGDTRTYLPADMAIKTLHDFSQGGKASLDLTRRWLVDAMFRSLASMNPSGVALLEHDLAMPSDPWLERCKLRWAGFHSDVYFVRTSGASKTQIDKTVVKAASQVLRGAVASVPEVRFLDAGKALSEKAIETFAKDVRLILVSAFDGEGYVLWKKS